MYKIFKKRIKKKKDSKIQQQQLHTTVEIQISKIGEILKWVINAIILCGKQYTALLGHREDIHNSATPVLNFLLF